MRAAARAVAVVVTVLACLTACASPTPPPFREDRTAPTVLPKDYKEYKDDPTSESTQGDPTHQPTPPTCVNNRDAGLSLNPAGLARASDGTPLGPKLAGIRERGRLIVGVSQTTPLSSRRDLATGEMEGFDVDIANGIARQLFGPDYASRLSLVTVPTDRRLYTLDTEENSKERKVENLSDIPIVDMVIADVSVTCDRVVTHGLKYSTPYLANNAGIMVRRGEENIRGPEDLAGRKVCSGAKTTNLDEMLDVRDTQRANGRPEVVVPVSTSDTGDCLMLLQQGLVDAIYTDVPILEGFRKQDPGTVVIDFRDRDDDYADGMGRVGVAMAKQDEDLVRFVNAALEAMRVDGSMERSRDRWYPDQATRPTLPQATYQD